MRKAAAKSPDQARSSSRRSFRKQYSEGQTEDPSLQERGKHLAMQDQTTGHSAAHAEEEPESRFDPRSSN